MRSTWFNRLPSRLPPSYVQKTVARLLPSQEALLTMTKDQLIKVAARKEELEKLVADDPVRFFQPAASGGQREFMTNSDPAIQGRYFFAANKTGKTTGGAIVCGEVAEGRPLWGGASRLPSAWLTLRPKRLCFFSEDFLTHEEAIVPTYASWMKRYILDVMKGPSGNLNRVQHKNGSIIYLRTYDQGYEKAEGKDYDLVWCDEPPPRDIYTAIFRGLVATKGLLLITATLLAETWLYDEIQQPFVKIYEATMYDNNWLDASARENFAALLTDEERAIRIWGKPTTLSGAIYPNFKSHRPSPFIVEQKEPPWNPLTDKPWPVVLGVDPHERKPVYCAWAYITPDNSLLWFDYAMIPSGSTKSVFKALHDRELTHKAQTKLVIGDPNRFSAQQIDGQSWQTAFEEHEYSVLLGNDDLAHGHFVVREMFDEPIRMFFMESCQGKDGPIYCLDRYTWEDWARGSRFERTPKEKPKEKHKDFPDIIRYVAVALHDGHISYETLQGELESIDLIGEDVRGVGNPYTN
jgi:phage terminase large subunit-like protein